MKEDNNEAEEKLITDDSLDNISIEKKHPKKEKLTTVDSLIDSNDKSNQLTMMILLNLNKRLKIQIHLLLKLFLI